MRHYDPAEYFRKRDHEFDPIAAKRALTNVNALGCIPLVLM